MILKDSFKILKKHNIKIATLTNGPKKNSINLLKKNKLIELVNYQFSIEDIKNLEAKSRTLSFCF